MLEAPFTEEEVVAAVNSCNDNKDPGPDGFSLASFQQHWGVVREDVMATVYHFYDHGEFERNPNAAYIALNPKKGGAVNLKDFRLGSVYKIIAKMLPSRLKRALDSVIGRSKCLCGGKADFRCRFSG